MSKVQKFKRGSRVKVCDGMPSHMSHFNSGFEAIVEYTYKQKYGGDCTDQYSLIVLKNGKAVNAISWYDEPQLTQLDGEIQDGLNIIEQYTFPQ